MPQRFVTWLWLRVLFVLLAFLHPTSQQKIVETLPGYNGTLPFSLETGYVSVGDNGEVQLFYYFVESERNPTEDPLVLWFSGGPGCSAFYSLSYVIGPLAFDVGTFDGSLPSLLLNQYSWTKLVNIIFLDNPVGAGFSYSTTEKGYYTSDTKSTQDTYEFLQKWLLNHPRFINHQLYIAGDSYAGKLVPIIATLISRGNEAGAIPHIDLKGYFIGNPVSNLHVDENERIPYALRFALISDHHYELAESCDGEYVTPDTNNKQCLDALQLIEMCMRDVNIEHILEPVCLTPVPPAGLPEWGTITISGDDSGGEIRLPSHQREESWCRGYNYLPAYAWANDPSVREALHVQEGTKEHWVRFNRSLAHEQDITSPFSYHQYLSSKNCKALVYSGDHDMVIPYSGTLKWIRLLNLTPEDKWRPWFVDGQVAGYTEKYRARGFSLTFATLKGGGHTAPEYKPKECFAMLSRWLSASAL